MLAATSVAYQRHDWTKSEFIGGLILIAVGLGVILIPVALYWRERDFLAHAVETDGTVVRVLVSPTQRGGGYTPEIRFADPTGRTWTVLSRISATSSYVAEQKVSVFYDARDPGRAQVGGAVGSWFNWTSSLALGVPGLILLSGGLCNAVAAGRELIARRRRRRSTIPANP